MPMLLDPTVTPYSAFIPTAVLSHPVVFETNAHAPTAVLLDAPYLLLASAPVPTAVLLFPEVTPYAPANAL